MVKGWYHCLRTMLTYKDLELMAAIEMAIENMAEGDLRDEFLQPYLKVKEEGIGICGRCRFTSGCLSCDVSKAWAYWCKRELGELGLKVGAKARGRPKAKPKPAAVKMLASVKGGGEASSEKMGLG